MDVKSAITVAKEYARTVFADEDMKNLGVEEVDYDEYTKTWKITLGFSRPRNTPRGPFPAALDPKPLTKRTYRVFDVSEETEKVKSVRIREHLAEQ